MAETTAESQGTSPTFTSRILDALFSALPAIGGAIGFAGFVALVGGALQWIRFDAAGLPAAQAVDAMPQSELVAIGAQSVLIFAVGGLLAVLVVYMADSRGEGNLETARALLVVVMLETLVVLALLEPKLDDFVGAAVIVVAFGFGIGWAMRPVWDLVNTWTSPARLLFARARWNDAAEALRIERALSSPVAVSSLSPEQAAAAAGRRAAAERSLLEAEVEWRRLVDKLEVDLGLG